MNIVIIIIFIVIPIWGIFYMVSPKIEIIKRKDTFKVIMWYTRRIYDNYVDRDYIILYDKEIDKDWWH